MTAKEVRNKTVVLAGGGHAHALLLHNLIRNPLEGVQLAMISPVRYAPYSGMLPGVIAGQYPPEALHIDLVELCRLAVCDFIHGRAVRLDADHSVLSTDTGRGYRYDWLSINTGSLPRSPPVLGQLGQDTTVIGVKPVQPFLAWLDDLEVQLPPLPSFSLGVLGLGLAGVEVALALEQRFCQRFSGVTIHLIGAGTLLSKQPTAAQQAVREHLSIRGIRLYENFQASVVSGGLQNDRGKTVFLNASVLCTSARPDDWLKGSGLKQDQNGFVLVDDALRSISHPSVIATGDMATLSQQVHPKSGVYAVRHAATLETNLRRLLKGESPIAYQPQHHSLTLLNMADGRAVGALGNIAVRGRWVWYWKNWLDQRFMKQFPRGYTR
ncbi:MAG: FAD-dependent oxidoreductase [Endozoicomonadaceae bacterium]|nr:FAD-dependent oxidoreductase [Endozoicomonadaceae bacterium]